MTRELFLRELLLSQGPQKSPGVIYPAANCTNQCNLSLTQHTISTPPNPKPIYLRGARVLLG